MRYLNDFIEQYKKSHPDSVLNRKEFDISCSSELYAEVSADVSFPSQLVEAAFKGFTYEEFLRDVEDRYAAFYRNKNICPISFRRAELLCNYIPEEAYRYTVKCTKELCDEKTARELVKQFVSCAVLSSEDKPFPFDYIEALDDDFKEIRKIKQTLEGKRDYEISFAGSTDKTFIKDVYDHLGQAAEELYWQDKTFYHNFKELYKRCDKSDPQKPFEEFFLTALKESEKISSKDEDKQTQKTAQNSSERPKRRVVRRLSDR
jgi:hypothetical protein